MTNTKGRLELSLEELKKRVPKAQHKPYPMDLKPAFPELFVKTTKVPRTLQRLVRESLDESMNETSGYYADKGDGVVILLYDKLKPNIAKIHADKILENIKKDLKAAMEADISAGGDEQGASAQGNEDQQKAKGDPELARVISEGLVENPTMKEMNYWAARVQQEVHLGKDEGLIPPEVADLVSKFMIGFYPLWNAENGVMAGYFAQVMKEPPKKTDGEKIRQGVAMFGAACQQLERLLAQKAAALLAVPIHTVGLVDKEVQEMYLAMLRKIPEPIRKCIIFEVIGLQKDKMPPTLINGLQAIDGLVRALIIDTGILSQPDFSRDGLNPHACGFDCRVLSLPQEQVISLMKKYTDSYKGIGVKTYIKALSDDALLEKAKDFGFMYLSGKSVLPPAKGCKGAYKISFEEIVESKKKT